MPSKKKKYNARFPPARIKKIMQADEEVGKVSAVVPVMISRTLEIFVESLLKKARQVTLSRNAKTLTPAHLKATINAETQFAFLREMVSTVPDIQTNNDDDGNSEPQQGSSSLNNSSSPPKKRNIARTNSRSRATSSRSKKPGSHKRLKTQRFVSREEDEDDDDEEIDYEDDEETEEDDGSSCDNSSTAAASDSNLLPKSSAPTTLPLLPSSSLTRPVNAADLVDDDYDDV